MQEKAGWQTAHINQVKPDIYRTHLSVSKPEEINARQMRWTFQRYSMEMNVRKMKNGS